MWLSEKLTDLLSLNVSEARSIREELAVVKAERDLLKTQLAIAQNNFDWCRVRLNAVELERTGLLEKAYNIRLPAPEIMRTKYNDVAPGSFNLENLFEGLPFDADEFGKSE